MAPWGQPVGGEVRSTQSSAVSEEGPEGTGETAAPGRLGWRRQLVAGSVQRTVQDTQRCPVPPGEVPRMRLREPRGGQSRPVQLGTRREGSRVPNGSDRSGWLRTGGQFPWAVAGGPGVDGMVGSGH